MQINADLHLHSKYSMATSQKMNLPTMAEEAGKKGIDLVGTGDCTHPKWLQEIKKASLDDENIQINDTHFSLTTEIEDKNRVHHVLILPSISKAEELAEIIGKHGDIESDGRPSVRMDGCDIAEAARDTGALIGPSHAFTPWTAIYAAHDSLEDCYGDMTDYISFVELGLSADSDYADRIKELHRLTFLTNSDAHSPWSNKLAREFTRFEVTDISFEGIEKAILRKEGYNATLNVGFFPQEGKYNESACVSSKCLNHYNYEKASSLNWKCPCGGRIKKGVYDRVNELANFDNPQHPDYRPEYIHLIPLAEIIMKALGHSSINTKGVARAWNTLIKEFGSEIAVLVDAELEALDVDERIIDAIVAFRKGDVILHPGGGGQYGWIELPEKTVNKSQSRSVSENKSSPNGQSSLLDY
ncbi:TIGR00375 family protein [Methanohalobium sp.]|uniref:TIGR00375 family protein n=1 Tax=Methanohalobium sp. TaxID=2837493 RepID=UPI0025FC9E32|nr:TIGR00375 family protein [Methanohalobium sp.]